MSLKSVRSSYDIKENLRDDHLSIHLDFAEDSHCKLQEEVKSAFCNMSNVTLQPVVVYFRHADSVKSFVFVSSEARHDAKFISALMNKLILQVKLLVPNVTHWRFLGIL